MYASDLERNILETVDKTGSLMSLFKSGYSYLDVINKSEELERNRLVLNTEDGIRYLTEKGRQRLTQLNGDEKDAGLTIEPLKQFKVEPMGVEDIYLP